MKKLAIAICLASLIACDGDEKEETKDEQSVEIETINGRTTVKISGNSVREILPKNVAELKISGKNHIACAEVINDLKFDGENNAVYAGVAHYTGKGSSNKIEPYSNCPIKKTK